MVNEKLESVGQLYSKNIEEKGSNSRSVGWNSEACQNLRFQKLCTVIDAGNTPFTVNDCGCEYGAQLIYLDEHFSRRTSEYFGYDISQGVLKAAEESHSSNPANVKLKCNRDIDTTADYSFAAGTFNVNFDAPREDWEAHIRNALEQLNSKSQKGFAFNLLTSYVDYEEDH